jgi:hypothetical protein
MNVLGYLVLGLNYVKPLSRPGKGWYLQFSIWPGSKRSADRERHGKSSRKMDTPRFPDFMSFGSPTGRGKPVPVVAAGDLE